MIVAGPKVTTSVTVGVAPVGVVDWTMGPLETWLLCNTVEVEVCAGALGLALSPVRIASAVDTAACTAGSLKATA